MYKVGICGHFGIGKNLLNGQTVKTKILREELVRCYGKESVHIIDTHDWIKHPLKLIYNCLGLCKNCENIIILPATRGVKVFVPLFLTINKLYKRRLHYVVIGGWLPKFVQNNNKLKNMLKKFDALYVETKSMIQSLNNSGIKNTYYLPNFKRLNILKEDEMVWSNGEPYKLCTFSRVMEEKGIEVAIEAVKRVNIKYKRIVYSLDIYGQIESEYEERFVQLKSKFPDYIKYCGVIPFNKSTEVLKNYFALLFPTTYEGEGFPGTVLDAFSSGIPIIASDWKYNREIIKNNFNGIIFTNLDDSVDELDKILQSIAKNPECILEMKKNCLEVAQNFLPEIAIQELKKKLEDLG